MILYSDRWLQSVPYFQVLSIAGLAYCLQSVNSQVVAAVGESRAMFIWTVIKRVVGIGFIIGGLLLFGMKGLLVGVVLNAWFSYFVNIGLVSKFIGYKWTDQLLNISPVLVASIVSALVAYGAGLLLNSSMYVDGVVKVVVYSIVYLGWSFIYKPEAYTYFLNFIPAKFRMRKK